MQYIINKISELIADNEPVPGSESIFLVNGFERLKLYSELATKLQNKYSDGKYTINIKLASRKWNELSQTSDNATIQQMQQNGWVADKESVTYYRNQHNVNILVLLGTEDEEDTGGLANCFSITPDYLVSNLAGYDRIIEQCFTGDISENDRDIINSAYKALFEYCPVDICKLSDIADEWEGQFDTINEFSEEFGKTLSEWGLPDRSLQGFKPQNFKSKKNFLRDEKDFISGKLFQKMTQKAYKGLVTKFERYAEEGQYVGDAVDWTLYGFHGYSDLEDTVLEFARGENVQKNRERLLKMDYSIVNDILKMKSKTVPIPRTSTTPITGEPIDVVLRSALNALRVARNSERSDLANIHFDFGSASIVIGYTDVDDDDKRMLLAETWKNICVHVNGLFEFINQNSWSYLDRHINIICETPDFFDPNCVMAQLGNTVTVASSTNTLNKINFTVKLMDDAGNVLQEELRDTNRDMTYQYTWKFHNESSWLYDFKDIASEKSLLIPSAEKIPVGVMQKIKNLLVIKSEEEFFDIYDEDYLDLSYDICKEVMIRASNSDDYDLKQIAILFSDLGKIFCRFVTSLSQEGYFNVLCGDIPTELNKKYLTIADKILSIRFDEDKQWVKDAFIQAFAIQDSTDYLSEDIEPECAIIPPWHPAAFQKLAAQKQFIIDGLSQKIDEYNEKGKISDINSILDRFIRMTEIQSSIDLFPANGNDYMGVLGAYGHYCVYGNERNISSIKTRIKDVIKKEAIYDDEFKTSELTKMNDDARMIYDVLVDYNKAMPSVKSTLSIVFINPPDLQPIIAAISKYTKDLHTDDPGVIINLKLSILVRPENKGGKNYLTYWMDDYFSEEKDTTVKVYLNEWSKKSELDKILSDNNDIVFNMDLLHAETFKFKPNPGETGGKVSDCRFPIVYKPSPISKTSKKRNIEITQTQFSASFKHTQVVRYKKNPEMLPLETYLAVRETSVENETKQIIDMLHKKAYWVVCIDKVMDGALLRSDQDEGPYAIIGFSTGKGMYGQYNLTITTRNSILETIENKLKARLYRLFNWKQEILENAVKHVMQEARGLDGISMLSAINQNGTNINEFMAYVMTSLREKTVKTESALKVIIHLDSYKHWFDNSGTNESSMRPDFLLLSVSPSEGIIKIKATVIECKTASFKNRSLHLDKAQKQVLHGLNQLQRLFDPDTDSIERRYWYAQLYRALVFAQVTFSDSSTEFMELSAKLRSILDGDFDIEWNGVILGYWVDQSGHEEVVSLEDGITIYDIPQECIQNILIGDDSASFIEISDEMLNEMDDYNEEDRDKEVEQDLLRKKNEILSRRKKQLRTDEVENGHGFMNPEGTNSKAATNETSMEENSPETDNGSVSQANDTNRTMPLDDQPAAQPNDSINTVEKYNDLRVLIGKDRAGNNVCWEFGNKGLSNRHLLITGTSGQGKTYGIQTMLYEVSKSNVSMVVFDYTEGFRTDQLEKKFLEKMDKRIDNRIVYFTGVPIDPFKRHEIEVAGMKAPEKISDVAQRIASTLSHVYAFGDQQFAAIYEACYSGLTKYGDNMSMKYLEIELNNSSNKSAKTVVSKMTPFLHSVEFSNERCNWDDILFNKEGRLTIFQLTNFVRDIQVIITEFMLWDMWHFTKKKGSKDKPFIVVLDEAQNLSHAENSPSGLILTEGRKFGWSAWYATQSLKVLNDDEVTRLMQSAFKLYFKPTADEIIPMAKQLNPMDTNEWKMNLTSLKKGECIVVGDRIQRDGVFKPGRPTITKVTSFEERE